MDHLLQHPNARTKWRVGAIDGLHQTWVAIPPGVYTLWAVATFDCWWDAYMFAYTRSRRRT